MKLLSCRLPPACRQNTSLIVLKASCPPPPRWHCCSSHLEVRISLTTFYVLEPSRFANLHKRPLFYILSVESRHAFCNRSIPWDYKTEFGRNPVMVVKNLNCFICNTYMDFWFLYSYKTEYNPLIKDLQ